MTKCHGRGSSLNRFNANASTALRESRRSGHMQATFDITIQVSIIKAVAHEETSWYHVDLLDWQSSQLAADYRAGKASLATTAGLVLGTEAGCSILLPSLAHVRGQSGS